MVLFAFVPSTTCYTIQEESREERPMTANIIIKVPSRRTRIVAVDRADMTNVLAHGKTTTSVLTKARKKAAKDPVLVFVPDPNKRYIY